MQTRHLTIIRFRRRRLVFFLIELSIDPLWERGKLDKHSFSLLPIKVNAALLFLRKNRNDVVSRTRCLLLSFRLCTSSQNAAKSDGTLLGKFRVLLLAVCGRVCLVQREAGRYGRPYDLIGTSYTNTIAKSRFIC